jgi:hypothetical protein
VRVPLARAKRKYDGLLADARAPDTLGFSAAFLHTSAHSVRGSFGAERVATRAPSLVDATRKHIPCRGPSAESSAMVRAN